MLRWLYLVDEPGASGVDVFMRKRNYKNTRKNKYLINFCALSLIQRGLLILCRVFVCAVAAALYALIVAAPAHAQTLEIPGTDPAINEDDAVPLALIVNELITNAMKHMPDGAGERAVTVRIEDIADGGIRLTVANPGRLPSGFDARRGVLHGNGLRIARSLLPAQGTTLDIVNCAQGVCATLDMRAPVIGAGDAPPAQRDASDAAINSVTRPRKESHG